MSIEVTMICRNSTCKLGGVPRSIPLTDPNTVSRLTKIQDGSLGDDEQQAAIRAIFAGLTCSECEGPLDIS